MENIMTQHPSLLQESVIGIEATSEIYFDCEDCALDTEEPTSEIYFDCEDCALDTEDVDSQSLSSVPSENTSNDQRVENENIKQETFEKKKARLLRYKKAKSSRKFTNARPFNLRTEHPPKPPVKENTKPLNMKLYSEIRAQERAGFDTKMKMKQKNIEEYKLVEERMRKKVEKEEIRKLRKHMVPLAQIMPFFDKPFLPKKSDKPLTVPMEPRLGVSKGRCLLKQTRQSEKPIHERRCLLKQDNQRSQSTSI